MTWYPIANLPPQYSNTSGDPYSGAVLKAYRAGTSINIAMATDYTGATTSASLILNAAGYPTSGGSIVIPHVQEDYKLALYPNQAAADINSGAVWTVDNIKIAEDTNAPFVQYFDGDNSNNTFTLTQDFGTDESNIMVFADRQLPEYQTNGNFGADLNWTKGAGWTIAAGKATATGAISTDIKQNAALNLIAGQSYTVQFTVTRSAGSLTPSIGGTAGTARSATDQYTETIIAGSTQEIKFTGAGFTGDLDFVTVKPVQSYARQILRPDEYTLSGNQLVLTEIPPKGTKNIIVFAPSELVGAAAASAAAAAVSETNAAGSAASAAAFSLTKNKYSFSTSTTMSAPGTGLLRFNNGTLASVTAAAISVFTAGTSNPSIKAWIDTWDDSTHAKKGTLYVMKDQNNFAFYNITAVNVDNTTWEQITLSHIVSAGSFSNLDDVYIGFSATGDDGDVVAANSNIFTGALNTFQNQIKVSTVTANTGGAGILLENMNGTDIALLGAGSAITSTWYGLINAQAGINPNASGGSALTNFDDTLSWTPGISGGTTAGTPSYSTQVGRGIRIGNWVFLDFSITLTGWTGTGQVQITGLPIAPASSTAVQSAIVVTGLTFANTVTVFAATSGTNTFLVLSHSVNSGVASSLIDTEITPASSIFRGHICYKV